MNAHNFLNALGFLWVMGGILLLPVNSPTCFFLCTLGLSFKLKIEMTDEVWKKLEKLLIRIAVLEIVWNLVFFLTSVLVVAIWPDANPGYSGFKIEEVFALILVAGVCPFLLWFIEGCIWGTIFLFIYHPVLATALFGGMALQSHFFDRIGSGNKR